MATAFLPAGRKTWSARIKVWDAKAGCLRWVNASVGAKTKEEAVTKGRALERASGEVRDGAMTREKVEKLVSYILELSGFQVGQVETLESFGNPFMETRLKNVSPGTSKKYKQHWKDFKTWAGAKMKRRIDAWTAGDFSAWYQHLMQDVSAGTANDHLRTLNMIFLAAKAHELVKASPLNLVEKTAADRAEKVPIEREEHEALLKVMLAAGRKDWNVFSRFGWHTGHRIEDLLPLLPDKNLVEMAGVGWCVRFQPKKKKGRGGREIILPIPEDLAEDLKKLGSFKSIHGGSNKSGKASIEFVAWLKKAGIDPLPVQKKSRTVHLKSFHSYRHSMTTRLISAGVTGEMARLVTDHDSKDVQKIYTHAEVKALAEALKLAK